MLMECADFLGATLAKPDPKAWAHLLTYAPKTSKTEIEALRPFVIPRDGAHPNAPRSESIVFAVDGKEMTVGEFRRARVVLKGDNDND